MIYSDDPNGTDQVEDLLGSIDPLDPQSEPAKNLLKRIREDQVNRDINTLKRVLDPFPAGRWSEDVLDPAGFIPLPGDQRIIFTGVTPFSKEHYETWKHAMSNRYTVYEGERQILAPVPESAVRSYLTSYSAHLERYTVYKYEPGDVGEGMGLTDGIPAEEWLTDNQAEGIPGPDNVSFPTDEEVKTFYLAATNDDMQLRGEGGIRRGLEGFLKGRRLSSYAPCDPEASRVIEFRDWVKGQMDEDITVNSVLDRMDDIWGIL